MRVTGNFYIYSRREDGAIVTNMLSANMREEIYTKGTTTYTCADRILKACRKRTASIEDKNNNIRTALRIYGMTEQDINARLYKSDSSTNASSSNTSNDATKVTFNKQRALEAIDKLIKFFTEFNFTPSYRFVNSMAIARDPKQYVRNYFAVQDHPYAKEIADKIKSAEFKSIIDLLKMSNCSPTPINTRFELYYGEPGTGKTTRAMDIADSCIICSSDMLPADLMQNFVFKDGKADFDPSDLWIAMEKGKSIVLDEVNMLPFESLRFLQGITDGKETFNYKGHEIKIHPDFKIYATMNLNVNGQCIPLPAPLVDRSYQIIEFSLKASDLIAALAS